MVNVNYVFKSQKSINIKRFYEKKEEKSIVVANAQQKRSNYNYKRFYSVCLFFVESKVIVLKEDRYSCDLATGSAKLNVPLFMLLAEK